MKQDSNHDVPEFHYSEDKKIDFRKISQRSINEDISSQTRLLHFACMLFGGVAIVVWLVSSVLGSVAELFVVSSSGSSSYSSVFAGLLQSALRSLLALAVAIFVGGAFGKNSRLGGSLLHVQDNHPVIVRRFGRYVGTITDPGLSYVYPWETYAIQDCRIGAFLDPIEDVARTLPSGEKRFVIADITFQYIVFDSVRLESLCQNEDEIIKSETFLLLSEIINKMIQSEKETIGEELRQEAIKGLDHRLELYGIRFSEYERKPAIVLNIALLTREEYGATATTLT